MIFVGADVHVRNSYFHATNENGQRLAHGRVANTPLDLQAFCERVLKQAGGELQPIRFALESTTNSRAVQKLLRDAATQSGFDDVSADVLDARKLRIIAESVMKTDAVDARAERIGALEPVAADLLHARRRRVRAARVSSRAAEPGTHAHDAEESRARRVPWASVKSSRLSMPAEPSGTETRALRA